MKNIYKSLSNLLAGKNEEYYAPATREYFLQEISRAPHEFETDTNGSYIYDDGHKIRKRRWAQTEGVSYYSGDGLNRANIMPDTMVKKLEESKNE